MVRQQLLPEWDARKQTAARQAKARRDYFAGEGKLGAAFTGLRGLDLDDPRVVRGLLARSDLRAQKRARERVEALDLPERRRAEAEAARGAALDAEDRADGLERRLVHAIVAHLEANPSLTSEALAARFVTVPPAPEDASDEEKAAVAAAALAADEDRRRLLRLAAQLRTAATVPGSAGPDVAEDLRLATDPERAEAAVQRLRLARPFLSGTAAKEADAAEAAFLEGPAAAELQARIDAVQARIAAADLPTGTLVELQARKTAAESALQQATAEATSLEGEGPLATARRSRARQQVALRTAELALVDAAVAAASQATDTVQAQADADAARQRADTAREQAQSAEARRVAGVLEALADAEERKSSLTAKVEKIRTRVGEEQTERENALTALESDTERFLTPTLLLSDKAKASPMPTRSKLGQDLRTVLDALRDDTRKRSSELRTAQKRFDRVSVRVSLDRARIAQEKATLDAISDETARGEVETALTTWKTTLDEELTTAQNALNQTRTARETGLQQLTRARNVRRRLGSTGGIVVQDITEELRLVGPMFVTTQEDKLAEAYDSIQDVGVLRNVVVALVWCSLLVFAIWAVRQRRESIVSRILAEIRTRWGLRPADLHSLRAPLLAVVVPTSDLLFGMLLQRTVREAIPIVGLLILTWLQVALYRLLMGGYDLCVVPHPQTRPALRVMRGEVVDRLRRTLRFVLLWFIARRFGLYLLVDVLALDTVAVLVRWGFNAMGVAIAVWALYAWEPIWRDMMARRPKDRVGVVEWLATDASGIVRVVKGLGDLAFLGAALAYDLGHWMASRWGWFGWLLNQFTRYQLQESEEQKAARDAPPDTVVSALLAPEVDDALYVRREAAENAVLASWRVWHREKRRGLVAFVGNRGEGKDTTLARIVARLGSESGRPIRRVKLEHRITRSGPMLRWLSEVFGLDHVPSSPDGMVEALQAQASDEIVVLEDVHLGFLRTVGGFEGLRTLLYVLNGVGSERFSILVLHQASMDFLSRLGSLINVGVFREIVTLGPLSEAQMRELTLGRLRAAGYEPDFTGLVRENVFGSDPELELERATATFFRLLTESSGGNAGVGLRLFSRCLCTRPGMADGVLEVHMHDAVGAGTLTGVNAEDLFTLSALVTQDELSEPELVAVTNMAPSVVRITVKHLEGLGLTLRNDAGRVAIDYASLPLVMRTLRRRRFLSWAA